MTDGLAAGTGGVDVGRVVGVEDGEGGGGEAFGGDVDVGAGERGGGGEENLLGEGLGEMFRLCSEDKFFFFFFALLEYSRDRRKKGGGDEPNLVDYPGWNPRIEP